MVAALVIVVLMFTLALAVVTARQRLVDALRANVVRVKRWGGWVLAAVGVWLLALAVFADFFATVFPV